MLPSDSIHLASHDIEVITLSDGPHVTSDDLQATVLPSDASNGTSDDIPATTSFQIALMLLLMIQKLRHSL